MKQARRKAVAFVLAGAMGAVLSVAAFREYQAYQIFSGQFDALAEGCQTQVCTVPYN